MRDISKIIITRMSKEILPNKDGIEEPAAPVSYREALSTS